MNILGIFMEGPNTGACLISDGVLVAMAEEERFVRVKMASEQFPSNAIRFCLEKGGIRVRDVDAVATAWDHDKYPDRMDSHMRSIAGRNLDKHADSFERIIHEKLSPEAARMTIRIALNKIDPGAQPDVAFYPHHLCHSASVHYLSGFDESSILVIDGSGEELATTTWHGSGDDIASVESWALPHSLGWFYAAITEWLGFKAYSGEGKVMGLAAYGGPDKTVADKLRRFCAPDADHVYRVDPRFVYYGVRNWSRKFTDNLVELLGPARAPESELTDYHITVAYEAQKLLEEVAIALTRRLLAQTACGNLCISGGVAMNCKMNGILSNIGGVDRVFINPASHDSGAALGAALLACRDRGTSPRKNVLTHAYWGPSFSDDQIEATLQSCNVPHRRSDNVPEEVADLLVADKIVGWFQGRAEFGARALGGRSILANPMVPDAKDRMNARVKFREAFRPFAPSMIEEVKDRYMVDPQDSPFMILAYPFKNGFRSEFPSIVHVDGSVRPQTVSRQTNPIFWDLISAFGDRSGHPIVLNTSFNVRGEPIVNTPLDAIRCFYSTGMDALAIGSFLLEKDPKA